MRQVFKLLTLACSISLLVGCSNGSNNDNESDNGAGNGSGDGSGDMSGGGMGTVACSGGGSDASVLANIGSQVRESDPAALDVAALSDTLSNLANGCAEAEPTPVSQGDSVSDVITRVNTQG